MSDAGYLQVAVTVSASQAAECEARLTALGALSITVEDAGDQPLYQLAPGDEPTWERCVLKALFAADADESGLDAALRPWLEPGERLDCSRLENKVWEREWMAHFQPRRFGERFWICPSWSEPPDPAAINMRLDPGLAFGTGTHPTTVLCLQWLVEQDLRGRLVIDYGCGSGILAIAALLVGCRLALAVDHDPQALHATRENGACNGLGADRLQVMLPGDLGAGPAELVIANILAQPLVELAPRLSALVAPGGRLLLSGLLEEQAAQVAAAYAPAIRLAPLAVQDGWVCLLGEKPAAAD